MTLLQKARPDDVDVDSCLANLSRLDAVNATGLLEGPPRPELDELAGKAAASLRTPMAFLTILDDQHQHLAGMSGKSADGTETRQQPVEKSYCQHVVAFDDVFIVDNALEDGLVASNPATTEDGVRAYLGVPIRKDGMCIGSFCVVDTKPRRWTKQNLAALERIAAGVMDEIDADPPQD